MQFRILYQDPYLIAIDKPAGFHVHPPEDTQHRISRGRNCLFLLRRQIDQYLYPVHRLDGATSGVLVFALQQDAARALALSFSRAASGEDSSGQTLLKKTYYCVARGWAPDEGRIDTPLKSENGESLLEATTSFHTVGRVELPHAVGRYPTARYSLVRAEPHTGRFHQIRRHFCRISHPLVGDTVYGDGAHNRFFRAQLKIEGLLLKAQTLELPHPQTGERLRIESRWSGDWHRLFEIFGVCPR